MPTEEPELEPLNFPPPVSDEDIQAGIDAARAALAQAEQDRSDEIVRVEQEIEERNVLAQEPVSFEEFAQANGIPYAPVADPELPDSINAPSPDVDPVPLPDGQEIEPPAYDPSPALVPVEYPAQPQA